MKKLCLMLFLLVILTWSFQFSASAASKMFSFQLAQNNIQVGKLIELNVVVNSSDLQENIAGFRISVQYDQSQMELKKVTSSKELSNNQAFRYYHQDGQIAGTYVCEGRSAPKLNGKCLTFTFLLDDFAELGDGSVSVKVFDIVDWSEQHLNSEYEKQLTYHILSGPSADAFLTELTPLTGKLKPEFSSDIISYQMTVPHDVASMEFTMKAGDGGSARINRKTLQRAGSVTDFIITVVSADKNNKSEYVVSVYRREKAEISLIEEESTESEPESKLESEPKSKPESKPKSDGESIEKAEKDSTTASSKPEKVKTSSSSKTSQSSSHKEEKEKTSSTKETVTEPGIPTQQSVVMPPFSPEVVIGGDRVLNFQLNQMPAFTAGLAAAFCCVLVGMIFLLVYQRKK